ncbi:nucleolar protein [Tanacetum coccineum]
MFWEIRLDFNSELMLLDEDIDSGGGGGLSFGEIVHGDVLTGGFCLFGCVGIRLVEMYVICEKIGDALKVFDEMSDESEECCSCDVWWWWWDVVMDMVVDVRRRVVGLVRDGRDDDSGYGMWLNGSNALNRLNETETDVYVNSSPLNLVSFWVTNVDRAHRAKNSVNVNGILKDCVAYTMIVWKQFSADKLVSKACTPYPYKDKFVDTGVEMYKGADFCLILERFTGQDFPLTVVPNWKCNGANEYCSKLGPFDTDTSIKATNGSFKGVRLSLQDVRCEETSLTGIWEASSGQLCMIGCRGVVNGDFNSCDSRVCLYIPLSFSIKQRSIIIGTIANVDEGKPANESYFPLAFEKQVRPYELYDQYTASHPSYKYSKIDLAGTVLERHEPFSFGTVIKKSLLTFPKLNDADSYLVGLSLLSEDLTLHHPAIPNSGRTRSLLRADVQFEILSIGSLFGHYWSQQNDSITEERKS